MGVLLTYETLNPPPGTPPPARSTDRVAPPLTNGFTARRW